LGKAKTRYVREHYREVKVRRDFYGELRRLAEARGLSVPALIEEMFKSYTGPSMSCDAAPSNPPPTGPSTSADTAPSMPVRTIPSKVAPSGPVQVTLWQNDPFWYLIRVGEGPHAVEISLNLVQLTKLCNTGLLAGEVCVKAQEVARRGPEQA
jgi:hypothetical protein